MQIREPDIIDEEIARLNSLKTGRREAILFFLQTFLANKKDLHSPEIIELIEDYVKNERG